MVPPWSLSWKLSIYSIYWTINFQEIEIKWPVLGLCQVNIPFILFILTNQLKWESNVNGECQECVMWMFYLFKKINWNGNGERVPRVCHVNGPSWFSGGTSLTRPYVLCNAYTYCTIRLWVLYNMSLRTVLHSTIRLWFVKHVFAYCTNVLQSLHPSLTLTMGHLSAGALLIEFLHRGRYLNESRAKNTIPTLVICQNTSFSVWLPCLLYIYLPALVTEWLPHSLQLSNFRTKSNYRHFREHDQANI